MDHNLLDLNDFDDSSLCLIDENPAGNELLPSSDEQEYQAKRLKRTIYEDDDLDLLFSDVGFDLVESALDLTKWTRCTLESVTKVNPSTTKITVRSTKSNAMAECFLKSTWSDIRLDCGKLLSIKAIKNETDFTFEINDSDGFVVINPDLLLSGTTILRSMFCTRRGIFCERYAGFEPTPAVMTIGTVLHEVFEQVLRTGNYSEQYVKSLILSRIHKKNFEFSLYGVEMPLIEIQNEIKSFIPKILQFFKRYLNKENNSFVLKKDFYDFDGFLSSIEDIEENIWLPQFGIKGRIDVTVKGYDRDRKKHFLAPLELKTGNVNQNVEHRGQLALYMLMLDELYGHVDIGLLLYLRDCSLKNFDIKRSEMRDLIKIRNEMSYYLLNATVDIEDSKLPEPIEHQNACRKCPYVAVCSSFARHENNLNDGHTFKNISLQYTEHLTDLEIEYFTKWSALLTIENQEFSPSKTIQHIWTLEPEERERLGKAISHVEIVEEVKDLGNGNYEHCFSKTDRSEPLNFPNTGLDVGQYIVVSSDSRFAMAAGFIREIENDSIRINLERNLQKKYPQNKFYNLDTYEAQSWYMNVMGTLALILENTTKTEHLRRKIVRLEPPRFSKQSKCSLTDPFIANILAPLNHDQKNAILKVLQAKDYLLIKGMAGCGKTTTIIALIEILVYLKKSIIITCQTHAAIDHICLKLHDKKIDFLRLGSGRRIDSRLHEHTESSLLDRCANLKELEFAYRQSKIVAVTSLGSNHLIFNYNYFDYCIIDESTQVVQVSLFRVLLSSKVFVLVGDPHQLPPIVKSQKAKKLGMDESLFQRLDNSLATVNLSQQYRMNCEITEVANKFTYNNQLECANNTIRNKSLASGLSTVNNTRTTELDDQLKQLLCTELQSSFQIVDIGPVWKTIDLYRFCDPDFENAYKRIKTKYFGDKEVTRCINKLEAGLVALLVENFQAMGVPLTNIGVIATYRAQIAFLREILKDSRLEICTIDQYQGRDKDIILFSCTKSTDSDTKSEFEILNDKRRLTVAITRAKKKFIMIGDVKSLKPLKPFQELLASIRSDQLIDFQFFDWFQIFQL